MDENPGIYDKTRIRTKAFLLTYTSILFYGCKRILTPTHCYSYGIDEPGFKLRQVLEIYLFPPRPYRLRSPHTLLLNGSWRQLPRAKVAWAWGQSVVKKEWSYTSNPPTSLHGESRENFTFSITFTQCYIFRLTPCHLQAYFVKCNAQSLYILPHKQEPRPFFVYGICCILHIQIRIVVELKVLYLCSAT